MRRIVVALMLVVMLGTLSAQPMMQVPEDATVLQSASIPATAEGIAAYLKKQVTGPEKPLTDAEADALIAKLGHDDFDTREDAMKDLLARRNPPVARLRVALDGKDLEIRQRSQEVLEKLARRSDPLAAVLRVARAQKFRLSPEAVLAAVEQSAGIPTREAGIALLVSQAIADDLPLAKKWAEAESLATRCAGIRMMAAIEKDRAVPMLRDLAGNPTPSIRLAVARALLDLGQDVDVLLAATNAPAEEAVFLLVAAEARLRRDTQDKRNDPKAMQHYSQVRDGLVIVLGKVDGVKFEERPAMNTQHYLEQHLDTSKHPEILFYQIQWFAGHWSGWLAPGFSDRMEDERKIRCWACFNDHNNKVITTTRRDLVRQILDLDTK